MQRQLDNGPCPSGSFDVFVASLPGSWHPALPIAASRAGAVGLLDLTHLDDPDRARTAVGRLRRMARGRWGLIHNGRTDDVLAAALEQADRCDVILLGPNARVDLHAAIKACRTVAQRVGWIATSLDEAESARQANCDFVVAKGQEAGGWVGALTSFVLLTRLAAWKRLPVVAWGGIGLHSATACQVAGAAGVLLDWQLALTRESPLPANVRRAVAAMDGTETEILDGPDGCGFRVYSGDELTEAECLPTLRRREAVDATASGPSSVEPCCHQIDRHVGHPDPRQRIWPIGQDAALAASWARRTPTVARALRALREHLAANMDSPADTACLVSDSPLARSHGMQYPIVQAPMTHVTESPALAAAVAEAGGLPIIAPALRQGDQLRQLLEETRRAVGQRPWGVALLRVAEGELRTHQHRIIGEMRPPVALVSGGRAEEAATLEARGIATYLYVASPSMLASFVADGARRFIFEGREAGGQIGPRSSFVLWDSMVDVLLDAKLPTEALRDVHVLFAGGIADCIGTRMISALARPLANQGVKVGLLVGTAYLFTHEIVSSGAAHASYQEEALRATDTTVVELRRDQVFRVLRTSQSPMVDDLRRQLVEQDRSKTETHEQLARYVLSALETAAKGPSRPTEPEPAKPVVAQVPPRPLYSMGQAVALRQRKLSIRDLHRELIDEAARPSGTPAASRATVIEPAPPPPPPLDIAVVGMSALFPGAHDVATYWHNVLARRDVLREIPSDRFEALRWFDPDRTARDKIYSKWGGFLDDVPFDPLKFGIPPATIPSIEPMQLLALELVDRALVDAGYGDANPAKERTSVIFGAGGGIAELGGSYAFRALLPQFVENPDESLWGQLPEWTEDSFAGILLNVVAGRVSNRFDLGGVNFTVDAACASSLAAIYLACRELVAGTSDVVVTGGCDTVQNPFSYLCFGKSGALSPGGRPRPFDAEADGITISEGLAAVVLKRREDAERDGDRIYAVLRALAGGSDGRSKGMTAPRPEGQIRTVERAYAQARFSPATVGLFEAHGTGTAVGDATECQSLSTVLNRHGAGGKSAALGSVKSMIGHTKCTAGVAGLIKSALALYHRVLPPTIHVENPNPKGGLIDGPLYVNSELRPWIRGRHPRRAGVSSFGFGGTNFHAVLEEYVDDALPRITTPPERQRVAELFVFEGASTSALATRVRALADSLKQAGDRLGQVDLANLAYTWHVRHGRDGGPHRAAVVAGSPDELATQLAALLSALAQYGGDRGALPTGVHYTPQPLGEGKPLAFMFPGQGSQYPNMLRDVAIEFSEVAGAFELADEVLADSYDRPLSQFVFPPPAFSAEERQRIADELIATDVLQPALGASSVGMARLLASFGVAPELMGGHSYGELVALYLADVFDEPTLYRMSRARGRAIVEMARSGADGDLGQMMAVRADEASVDRVLEGVPNVWMANLNSPRQTIVSATRAGMSAAIARLDEARLAHTALAVACGFHSPLMAPARSRFAQFLSTIELHPPKTAVYSNRTADVYSHEAATIRLNLAEHLVDRVQFAAEVEAMYSAGARVFLEVGPNNVLSRLVDDILGDRPHVAVATNAKKRHGVVQVLDALAELIAHGIRVDVERLYAGRDLAELELGSLGAEAKPLPAHMWLINGGYARPVGQPPRRLMPRARLTSGEPPSTAAAPVPAAEAMELSRAAVDLNRAMETPGFDQVAPQESAAASTAGLDERTAAADFSTAAPSSPEQTAWAAPGTAGDSGIEMSPQDADAFAQFQHTMRQFLATQEAALAAFYGTRPAAPPQPIEPSQTQAAETGGAATVETVQSSEHATDRERDERAAEAATPAHQTAAATGAAVDTSTFDQMLINIVSERTGYPADMLERDANMEADLGIDSIKRVEIIGAFRRAALPEMEDPPGWFMEQMTAAATLREIVAGVSRLAVEQPAVASVPTNEAPSPASAPTPTAATSQPAPDGQLEQILTDIVSERTGYPADMLDPDADLEADLGIDSIKRVEIIGAFRRAAAPQVEEPPAWFMEQMGSAGSLRDILSGIAQLTGDAPDSAAVSDSAEPSATAAEPSSAAPPAEPASSSMPSGPSDLHAMLVEIVAERTGYPPDMLDPEANLEADLGIDSIKRVEIIGAFRRAALPQVEEPPAWFMEEMTSATCLRTIVEGVKKLKASLDGEATSPQPAAATHDGNGAAGSNGSPQGRHASSVSIHDNGRSRPAAQPVESCPRCVPAVVEIAPAADRPITLPAGLIVVTSDGGGLAESLCEQIAGHGGQAAILDSVTLTDASAVSAQIDALRRQHGAIGGVLHLAPLAEAPAFPGIDGAAFNELAEREVRGMLFLLQAIAPELKSATAASVWAAAVTLGGSDFGGRDAVDATRPWRGGLAGMLKAAAREWTEPRFRAIDADEPPNAALLLAELSSDGPVEVGYRGGRRLCYQPRRDQLPNAEAGDQLVIGADSVVLVSGGARGITARIVAELAQRTGAAFVLLGRTPLPSEAENAATAAITDPNELARAVAAQLKATGENIKPRELKSRVNRLLAEREIRATLAAVAAAGSTVEYIACDVRDPLAMTSVIRDVEDRLGAIDAIIHGAGVIEDRYIVDKTPESYDRVWGTKLDPLLTLLGLIDAQRLRALLLFSSVAGFFGNAGQSDYAAANETLNRIACRLHRLWPSLRVVALNWGPWEGVGMVTPEVARQFASRGVGMVRPELGCQAVAAELRSDGQSQPCVLYGPGPWLEAADRLAAATSSQVAQTPLLSTQQVRLLGEGVLEAEVVLDLNLHAYLRDHCIDNKPVLPAAVAMELIAEAAANAMPDWHVHRIENLRMFKGVVVDGQRRELALRAEPIDVGGDSGQWRVRITDVDRPGVPLYEAMVHLAASRPTPPPAPELERIATEPPLSAAEAYDQWLFHGPLFRTISQLQGLDPSGVDAVVTPGCPKRCVGPHVSRTWLIDPSVIDAAPQLALLWSRAVHGTSQLPNRVAAYHRYEPLAGGPLELLVRVDPATDASSFRANAWLIRGGRVAGYIEGLECAGSAALNRIGGSYSR